MKKIILIALMCAISTEIFAKNGVPVDADGNTLPSPVGNIPFFKMPNALAADNGEYTWDYSGTLSDGSQLFSFQASLAQLVRGEGMQLGLGFHMLDFAFQQGGVNFFSNSTFGGNANEQQAMAQSIDWVSSSASLQNLTVTNSLVMNAASQWSVQSVSQNPRDELYKGYVGQPGHEYRLSGTGQTYLWRYDTKGQSTVVPYRYTFSVDMMDERGATMEGMNNGYVGPKLVPLPASITGHYNVESEIAQPRLKVLDWQLNFSALASSVPAGYQNNYSFSGHQGMLWNDFGPVGSGSVPGKTSLGAMIGGALASDIKSKANLTDAQLNAITVPTTGGASLYNGSWIPVNFTTGKYKGLSLAFSAFWNKKTAYPKDQTTDNPAWSTFGWCNLFSGIVANNIQSAFSLVQMLYPENPGIPTTFEKPPYEIHFNQFVPAQYGMAFPWVQSATITIRPYTALRYAMAIYADERARQPGYDDPSKPVIIQINAISPVTQNTLFSDSMAPYYEGAAIPTIDNKVVGYAWLEHMI